MSDLPSLAYPSLAQKCANVCNVTNQKVLTAEEMMTVVAQSPQCVPLCEQMQASGKYVGREGVGLVQADSYFRDDRPVVGGRVVAGAMY